MGMNETAVWVLTITVGIFAVALALKSQLASVIERRRDVAVLKAIGWTDLRIVGQVLAESCLQALGGGLLGSLLATEVLRLVPPRLLTGTGGVGNLGLSTEVFVAALILALLGGVVAGALPALLAARSEPARVLRRI
jgi:putative ABC transport system permease protein